MSLTLDGVGTAVPPCRLSAEESARFILRLCCRTRTQHDQLLGILNRTGISARHLALSRPLVDDVLCGTTTSGSPFVPVAGLGPTTGERLRLYLAAAQPLAEQAARQALAEARLRPAEVTHLVTVSCTGFAAPGIDLGLVRALGLPNTVQRTNVGFMGCHGALNGLRVAAGFAGADPDAAVLLCAIELPSLHAYSGDEPQKQVGNALFSDGAAALAGRGRRGSPGAWRVRASGSCVLPDSAADMSWVVGDNGFEMTLSRRVPVLIGRHLRPWLDDWLASHGVAVADVGSWAVHPGGPRILSAVGERLGLTPEALEDSAFVLREYGNMSSPTVLFILDRLLRRRAPLPCVALAFGPGLTAEAALIG